MKRLKSSLGWIGYFHENRKVDIWVLCILLYGRYLLHSPLTHILSGFITFTTLGYGNGDLSFHWA